MKAQDIHPSLVMLSAQQLVQIGGVYFVGKRLAIVAGVKTER